MARKDFKKFNTGFICISCKHENPPAPQSERNHCRKCLRTMHVDGETPGDRESVCGGVMTPVGLEYKGNKGYVILHRCESCGKTHKNRAAEDDEGIDRLS